MLTVKGLCQYLVQYNISDYICIQIFKDKTFQFVLLNKSRIPRVLQVIAQLYICISVG